MSYSQKRYPNDQAEFPRPPEWLVWTSSTIWDGNNYVTKNSGQVRHLDSLQKCKKYVSPYGSRDWNYDWTIYHWDGAKYIAQFEGKRGENKLDHELWKMRVKKSGGREYVLDDNDVQAAIESILKVSDE